MDGKDKCGCRASIRFGAESLRQWTGEAETVTGYPNWQAGEEHAAIGSLVAERVRKTRLYDGARRGASAKSALTSIRLPTPRFSPTSLSLLQSGSKLRYFDLAESK